MAWKLSLISLVVFAIQLVAATSSAERLSERMWPVSVEASGTLSRFDHSEAPSPNDSVISSAFDLSTNDPAHPAPQFVSSASTGGTGTPASKITNLTSSWIARDASWSEQSHEAFMSVAFEKPRSGSCDVLSPDPAYVEEMLVDIESIGSKRGKTYQRRVALVVGNSAYTNGVDPLVHFSQTVALIRLNFVTISPDHRHKGLH